MSIFGFTLTVPLISVDVHVTADHSIKATLNTVPGKPLFCSNDYISRVFER